MNLNIQIAKEDTPKVDVKFREMVAGAKDVVETDDELVAYTALCKAMEDKYTGKKVLWRKFMDFVQVATSADLVAYLRLFENADVHWGDESDTSEAQATESAGKKASTVNFLTFRESMHYLRTGQMPA